MGPKHFEALMTAPAVARARRRVQPLRTAPYRILVASAAEPSSLGAITLATALARRRSASVHALIVATPFPHTFPSIAAMAPPAMVDDESRRAALERLRQQLATIRGTGEWAVRATSGFPAESISAAAARWPASVVIMGSGDHTLARRLLGSETAVKLATHATVPVLAVPADARELPTRAVAAVDFSESSIEAAHTAATLLGQRGRLTLMYASPLIVDHAPGGTLTDLYTAGARDRLETIADDVHRRSKRPVSIRLASGDIVERLNEMVEADECDLIAMGAHEPTLLERVLVGHVRARVIRSAACSVLVVPHVGPA
jgi:nucleotide-binding universal stress UspA family protein